MIKAVLDVPVLYGGSVKPDNAAELLAQPRRRRRARRRRIPRRRLVRRDLPSRFPLVTLVILDGFGCAPPGPGNAVELAETPVFDRLWREFPHTTIEASGEAAGLPPGPDGQLRGRAPDDRRGPPAVPGSDARQQGDRGRLVLRAACAGGGVRARPQACICSVSSHTAACTRTSTTCRRCCASRPRRRGSTRSPTGATSRRHRRRTILPSCRSTGSRPWSAATGRWTAISGSIGRSARTTRSSTAVGHAHRRRRRGGPSELRRGGDRRVHRADRRRRDAAARAGRHGDLLQFPSRPRPAADAAVARSTIST